jgi:DNA circularisation protein N-terminus
MTERVRPVLGELELPLVQRVTTEEAQAVVRHQVPAQDGELAQRLHRAATRVVVRGILAGATATADLEALRALFQAGDPLPFVADVMTATEVRQMLVADLRVGEVAGKPDTRWYETTLEEFVDPSVDQTAVADIGGDLAAEAGAQNEERIAALSEGLGILEVVVLLASGERDYSIAQVEVEGTTAAGARFVATIEQGEDGLFRLEQVPAGDYSVRAVRLE